VDLRQTRDKSKCIIKSKSQQNQNQKNQSLKFTIFSFRIHIVFFLNFFEADFANSSIFGKNSIFYGKVTLKNGSPTTNHHTYFRNAG
jgi:hypothetical protein